MSIISTPTLNATETIQVATPFSYSFTYSTVITTSDPPVYYYNNQVYSNGFTTQTIKFISDAGANPIKITGLTYTLSNMSAVGGGRELEGDVLECQLPILNLMAGFSLDAGSSITFGGPTKLYIEGGPPGAGGITGYYASFSGVGKFSYGLDDSMEDSLQYIPLAATPGTSGPAVSFKIKLLRPHNTYAAVDCTITANVMTVTKIYGQLYGGGQVTKGMIFLASGDLTRNFTVTSYITSSDESGKYGENGTYGITPTDGGGAITVATPLVLLQTGVVAGSGDILLSASMTPSDGTAQFVMDAPWSYNPEV
jgi:hypothetical protein